MHLIRFNRLLSLAGAVWLSAAGFAAVAQSADQLTAAPPSARVPEGERVIGGRPAAKGAWPWQVKMFAPHPEQRGRFGGHCGGTVIAPSWVLTAAHCFMTTSSGRPALRARDIVVVAGESSVRNTISVQPNEAGILRAKSIIIHPGFEPKTFENDLALIELAQPSRAKPIALAGAGARDRDLTGTEAVVTGWGFVQAAHGFDPQHLPTELQEVALPIVGIEACARAYRDSPMRGNPIDGRNLCAGFPEGGRDTCQGDSGGPLMVRAEDGAWLQAGIVSWGEGCALRERYGVYTRVAAFADWIRSATGGAVEPGRMPAPPGRPDAPAPNPSLAALPTPPPPRVAPAQTAEAPPLPDLEPGDRALLIGIDDYPQSLRLVGSVNDVGAMRELLTSRLGYRPEQVMTLTNQQATRANILAALDGWLVRGTSPGSRAFLHFSGHGYQTGDLTSDEEDNLDETLVPIDVEIVRNSAGRVSEIRNQIIDDEIAERIALLKDRQLTIVIDACHSGTSTRDITGIAPEDVGTVRNLGPLLDLAPNLVLASHRSLRSPGGPKPTFIERQDKAVVWSAVADDQLALVDRTASPPMGVFTRRFIEGVTTGLGGGEGRTGRVSYVELLDFVRRESARYCEEAGERCRLGLTPQLEVPTEMVGQDVATGSAPQTTAEAVQSTLKADNPAGVAIEILPGAEVEVGAKMAFRVSTKRPGHLILVDVDAEGRLTQIFPNRYSLMTPRGGQPKSNLIRPGRPVEVPDLGNPYAGFEYVAEPPAGSGLVVAILSDQPVQLVDLPDVPLSLVGQRAAFNYIYDLARTLRITPEDENGKVTEPKWSFAAAS